MTMQQTGTFPKVFKGTNRHEGWREIFTPASGATRYLTYARCILGPNVQRHVLAGDEREWAIFCISGPVDVAVADQRFTLARHDILYVPRRCTVEMGGRPGADLALGGSPAHIDASPHLIRFADIKDRPEYVIDVGSRELGTQRRIYNMLGGNVQASRLLAGFTVGTPGAWTSWPPHEHNDSKEEFYLFFDMPTTAFSTQFVFTSVDAPELVSPVRDGDCVAIPWGYHPTAAAPGYSTVFMWCMAAFDPEKHRDLKYGVNIHPDHKDVKFF